MPKYYKNKVCGYYLYYTSFCLVECMHAHASDSKLTEIGSAKFFAKSDGSTVVQKKGMLSDREVRIIQVSLKSITLRCMSFGRVTAIRGFTKETD